MAITPVFAEVKPLSFYYLPNLNLTFEKNNDSYAIAQEVINKIKADTNVDFNVFGGNLTLNIDGTYNDIPFFTDLADSTEKPYYVIFGNNDARLNKDYTTRDFTSEFRKNGFNIPELTYWNDESHEGYNIIGLDTTICNSNNSQISKEQYRWLAQTLNTYKVPTIMFMYHSAVETGVKVIDETNLADSKQFIDFVANFPQIKLIISGNTEINFAKKIGQTFYFNAPSITSYPNMYEKFTLYPDRIEVTRTQIPYKQLIKKHKTNAINSEKAKNYNPNKSAEFLDILEGDKFSKQEVYYFLK